MLPSGVVSEPTATAEAPALAKAISHATASLPARWLSNKTFGRIVSFLKKRDRSASFPRRQPEASAALLGAVGAACGDVGFRFNERFTETRCCQPGVRVVFVIRRLR